MLIASIAYLVLSSYILAVSSVSVLLNSFFGIIFTPFAAIGGALQGNTYVTPGELTVGENFFSSMASGLEILLLQFSDFIQGLFAGQLIAGAVFTNFMLITILGFVSLNLFISFSLYETKLVPTR